MDAVIFTHTQINRRFPEIQTSAAVLFDVGGGGAWQVYSHRRWVTASCFMARCSTSGLAAIGRDEPWWWDLSVLLGITNKTDSPVFYRHRCSDNDTERRLYLRGPEHINTTKMYPCVAVCHFKISLVTLHCQKSLKNPPMDDFSSVMKLQWTFDSGWTEFWQVSKNERKIWLIWVMKDKKQTSNSPSAGKSFRLDHLLWWFFIL